MFLCDKYAPQSLNELVFHKDIIERMIKMSKDDAIPHLIFYGPDGAGKKTIVRLLLENIYDKSINNTVDTIHTINGSGNTTNDILIKQSAHHIVIDPNNNNFDRYLIQDIVKSYARQIPLDVYQTSKKFKIVLINDTDNLSYYAQMSLRRTMEAFSKTCRFILICNAITKLIDPLKSRCVCIRVPSPTRREIIHTIMNICYHEKYKITCDNLTLILDNANQNIKHAIWLLNNVIHNLSPTNTYINCINEIVKLILTKKMSSILDIRLLLYNNLTTNIAGSTIISDITNILCQRNISDEKKMNIITMASKYSHNLALSRRDIIQLDSFIGYLILVLR